MKKFFKLYFVVIYCVLLFPIMIFAAQVNPMETEDIDPPPPSAPIDNYVLLFFVFALFLAGFVMIKHNFKKQIYENN
jgi:hypothetical protein